MHRILWLQICTITLVIQSGCQGSYSEWSKSPNEQYHIQTDEGPERFFKYQTTNGQYRKEKRLEDGTVIGTTGWVDPNGYLRLQDYIADNAGYRVLKSKMVFVGKNSLQDTISYSKKVPAQSGTLVSPTPTRTYLPVESTTAQPFVDGYVTPVGVKNSPPFVKPIAIKTQAPYLPPPVQSNDISYQPPRNKYYTPPEVTYQPPYRSQPNKIDRFDQSYNQVGDGYTQQYSDYDGVSVTSNGFRYYLPRQYHEEENLPNDKRTGSFGYIDPFGIRRVIYYNTAPGTGFVHRKNNRYVGFNATPYDPRPY